MSKTAPVEDTAYIETLAERVERRLTIPVLVAALVSVPAVFLAAWGEGWVSRAGLIIDWGAGMVLWLEWIVLFVLAEDRWDFFKRHKWTLSVALLTIPALIFALGPAQLLRAAYMVVTLRILRVRRIINAARVVHRRLEPTVWMSVVLVSATGVVALVFVAVLLTDPKSETWLVAQFVSGKLGIVPAMLLGVILAVTGFLFWRNRKDTNEDELANNC